jgi:hypothetical protein
MWDATLAPPWSRMRVLISVVELRTSATAIVSPRARPRPSMLPPTTPPRPKGSTTARIMPQRVPPRARAPSHSTRGAWENTSRHTEVMIGVTITATTTPAMNREPR